MVYKAVGKGYILGYTSSPKAFLRVMKKMGWKKKDIKFVRGTFTAEGEKK